MPTQTKQLFEFGRFLLDANERVLARNSKQIRLAPKVFDTLMILVRNAGHVVRKEELMRQIWPDAFVEENNLDKNISALRKALGDKTGKSRFITTVPKQGYRFTADTVERTTEICSPSIIRDSGTTPAQTCLDLRQGSNGTSSSKVFVGRESELNTLYGLLERTRLGPGRMVFITGEPGIGKTALLERFSADAEADDQSLILARGRCLEHYGTGEAYLPVLDAFYDLFSGPHRDRVTAVLPVVAPTWRLQFPSVFGSGETQERLRQETIGATKERMLREMGDTLERLSADSPVVLFLEDLHWSDPSSIDLLRLLCLRAGRQRLLLIGTFRPDELDVRNHPLKNCMREMQAHGECTEIALERLSQAQVSLLLDAHFTPNVFPAALATLIHQKTEGHPLFTESLAQYLRGSGHIVHAEGQWKLTCELAGMALDVPETASGMIRKKLDILDEEDRRILQYAAIEGEEFTSAVLAGLLSTDQLLLEERLHRLCRVHHLIQIRGEEELPDGTLTTRYRFAHILYQNFLYADLVAKRRILLHRRAGEEFLRFHRDQAPRIAAQLAIHFERGQDFGRAIEYLGHAGDNAAAVYAHAEADEHLSRALSLVERLPSEDRSSHYLHLYYKRGLVRFALSRFDEALSDFTKMTDLARLAECPQLEGKALSALSHVLFFIHRLDEMAARACDALRVAERSGNESLRALTLTFIARRHICLGDLSKASAMLDESIRVASTLDDKPVMVAGLGWRGALYFFQSEYDAAERTLARALDLSTELRDQFMVAFCRFFFGLTYANLGRISEALTCLQAITKIAERNGERYQVLKVPNSIGWIYRELGDFDGALAHDRAGIDVARRHNVIEAEVNSVINVIHDHTCRGESDNAEPLFAEAGNLLERDDWLRWRFGLRLSAVRCEQLLLQGNLVSAEASAGRLIEIAEGFHARKYIVIGRNFLAAIAEARHDMEEAETQLTAALEVLRQYPTPLIAWKTYAALGRIRLESGANALAREAFEQAAAIIRMIAANVEDERLRTTFLESPPVSKVLLHSHHVEF